MCTRVLAIKAINFENLLMHNPTSPFTRVSGVKEDEMTAPAVIK